MIAREPTDLVVLSPTATAPVHVVRDIIELAAAAHEAQLTNQPNAEPIARKFLDLAAKHAHAALGMSTSNVPAPTSQELYYRARLQRVGVGS